MKKPHVLVSGCFHGQRVEGLEAEARDLEVEEGETVGDLHRTHSGLRGKAQRRQSQGKV